MKWFLGYLGVGLVNWLVFAVRGPVLRGVAGLCEMLLFVLLWPIQLVYKVGEHVIGPIVDWIGKKEWIP